MCIFYICITCVEIHMCSRYICNTHVIHMFYTFNIPQCITCAAQLPVNADILSQIITDKLCINKKYLYVERERAFLLPAFL